jgi:hypothetical protein
LYTDFFVENIGGPFFAIRRGETGNLSMGIGLKTEGLTPIIAASDVGKWALVAFKNPDQWICTPFQPSF